MIGRYAWMFLRYWTRSLLRRESWEPAADSRDLRAVTDPGTALRRTMPLSDGDFWGERSRNDGVDVDIFVLPGFCSSDGDAFLLFRLPLLRVEHKIA